MGTDLFIKITINATSFRSWNLTLEGLYCNRDTDKRSGKQQFQSKKEFLKQQIKLRDLKKKM